MFNTLLDQIAADQATETHRHAYNAAFDELGLAWHWDASVYARLQAETRGADAVRTYLETEQAHLLRAYDAQFLVDAIEAAKARCDGEMAHQRAQGAPAGIRNRFPAAFA